LSRSLALAWALSQLDKVKRKCSRALTRRATGIADPRHNSIHLIVRSASCLPALKIEQGAPKRPLYARLIAQKLRLDFRVARVHAGVETVTSSGDRGHHRRLSPSRSTLSNTAGEPFYCSHERTTVTCPSMIL